MQPVWGGGCPGHTWGSSTVLKGMDDLGHVHVHCTSRCKCDSPFFPDRGKPHKGVGVSQLSLLHNVCHQTWGLQSMRTCQKVNDETLLQDSDKFNADCQVTGNAYTPC